MMAQSGVDPFTISKVLGHADPRGVTAIYDRYSYDDPKRKALNTWGRRLEQIVAGRSQTAKVVNIR